MKHMTGSDEKKRIIDEYLDSAIGLMKAAHIVLTKIAKANVYHHLGADKLGKVGALFINVVNRDYCKSIVVMLPGQQYPDHYHRIKSESFYVLSGVLDVTIDGQEYAAEAGELLHVDRGQDHSFSSREGTIFEEISTMYVPNDSIYLDDSIAARGYDQRRTTISAEQWKEIVKNA